MKIKKEFFPYFEKAGRKQIYYPSDLIYMQEDEADLIYLIIKGKVKVFVMNSNGKEVTMDILQEGQIFGESAFITDAKRPTTIEALTHVELLACYPTQLYPYFQQSQEFMVAIFQSLSQTCDYLTNMIKRSYTYNRYEKIIAFLLGRMDLHQSSIINYTHEEIASILGLSRVTVTKVLNEFVKEGLIEIRYKSLIIKDKKKLYSLLYK